MQHAPLAGTYPGAGHSPEDTRRYTLALVFEASCRAWALWVSGLSRSGIGCMYSRERRAEMVKRVGRVIWWLRLKGRLKDDGQVPALIKTTHGDGTVSL